MNLIRVDLKNEETFELEDLTWLDAQYYTWESLWSENRDA